MWFIVVLHLEPAAQASRPIQNHRANQKIGQASTMQLWNFFDDYTPQEVGNEDLSILPQDWLRNAALRHQIRMIQNQKQAQTTHPT